MPSVNKTEQIYTHFKSCRWTKYGRKNLDMYA